MSKILNNTENLQSLLEILQNKVAGGGIDTTDATATPEDITKGETAYVNGEKITGTFTIDEELSTQEDLVSQIQTVLQDKASVKVNLQSKTITPTAESQTIIADNGYDGLDSVIVNGDENLVAENIVNGKSIFGVVGSASSGGNSSVELATVSCAVQMMGMPTIHYLNENLQYTTVSFDGTNNPSGTFSVVKNSIILILEKPKSQTGNFIDLEGSTGKYPYVITGNASFNWM